MNLFKNPKLVALIPVFVIACSSVDKEEQIANETLTNNYIQEILEDREALTFSLNMELEKLSEDQYHLITTVKLDEGAYFASPFSNNSFSGLFNIEFNTSEFLTVADTLIESPQSVETFDHFSNEMVNWVEVETSYTQLLTVNSREDFSVNGIVSTVIEPVCNRYEIVFNITSKSGALSVYAAIPVVRNL